jgi:hypothetical protein
MLLLVDISVFAEQYRNMLGLPRFAQFTSLAVILSFSLATAQTPTSSVPPEPATESVQTDVATEPSLPTADTPSPAPTPRRSPKPRSASATTRTKTSSSPAATARKAGFGQVIPGLHTAASPAPARDRKSKAKVAEKTASPSPAKSSAVGSVKQTAPATNPTSARVSQPASTTPATPAPVSQATPATGSIAVRGGQPTVTTAPIVVPVEPPPPAEGPLSAPVKQRTPPTLANSPAVEQPAPITVATAAPVATAPPIQQPKRTTHGNPTNAVSAVWVNTETHVYHRAGSRYYGKTKNGKYISEQEAIAEGNRPAREWLPPNPPHP